MKNVTDLNTVKVGEHFMVYRSHGWRESYLVKVVCEKVTPSQAVIGGQRFWKKNGRPVGDSFGGVYEYDEKAYKQSQAALTLSRTRDKLREIKWGEVPDDLVLSIYDSIKVHVK